MVWHDGTRFRFSARLQQADVRSVVAKSGAGKKHLPAAYFVSRSCLKVLRYIMNFEKGAPAGCLPGRLFRRQHVLYGASIRPNWPARIESSALAGNSDVFFAAATAAAFAGDRNRTSHLIRIDLSIGRSL